MSGEPIINRASSTSQYARSVKVSGGEGRLNPVVRGTWHVPTLVTVQSVVDGIIDTAIKQEPAGLLHNEFTPAHCRLRIKWSDGNVSFQKDIPANTPCVVVATVVEVTAYLALDNITQNAQFAAAKIPNTVVAYLTVSITDGASPVPEARYDVSEIFGTSGQLSGTSRQTAGAPSFAVGAGGGIGPKTLYGLSGYHEMGAPLYVQLYDAHYLAARYPVLLAPGTFDPDYSLVDGAINAAFSFKVPDSENYSVTFERGLVFQHGLVAMYSSTPEVLTTIVPFTFNWAANWNFADPGAIRPLGE